MTLWKYTNGTGHFVMSILFLFSGLFLIVYPGLDAGIRGIGIGLISTVASAWFIPNAAKQTAQEVKQQVSNNNSKELGNGN